MHYAGVEIHWLVYHCLTVIQLKTKFTTNDHKDDMNWTCLHRLTYPYQVNNMTMLIARRAEALHGQNWMAIS